MLKAVSFSDFDKYGCINCGCATVFHSRGIRGINTFPVKCCECSREFIILSDGKINSEIFFGTDKKGVYDVPSLEEHPRKNIKKHQLVKTIISENKCRDLFNGSK